MQQILLIVQLLLATGLIGAVLLQRSESDGFGLGSGGSNFLSGRASATLMTRTTAILAALFIANSLLLSIVASHHGKESIVDAVTQEEPAATPAEPAVPNVPIVGKKAAPAPVDAPEKAPVHAPKIKESAPAPKKDAAEDAKTVEDAAPVGDKQP